MAHQTGKNLAVNYTVEATTNVAPGTGGGETLRITSSPGLKLTKTPIQSQEFRADGMTAISRHGSRSVGGSFNGELSAGTFDTFFAAVMRCTAVAVTTLTESSASLAAISFTSNTINATTTGAQSWHAAGVRVGDVLRLSSLSGDAASNDDINALVIAMTTHTLTVPSETFTAASTAVSTWTAEIGKKFTQPTTPIRRSFYVEQYDQDIDLSTVFGGCRVVGMTINGTPDGMANVTFNLLGMSATALATGTSPYHTSPTTHTTDALVFADAKIALGGASILKATSFTLNFAITAATEPVVGSSITPDVFDNDTRLSGTLSILREDLSRLSNFIDEDELELSILLQEPGTAPQPFISFFIPRLKFMDADAPLGSDGAKVDSLPWEAGFKTGATNYDQTMLTITTQAS